MEKRDNYAIQAMQAKGLFLQRDHTQIARKLHTEMDADYLYTRMFGEEYRIGRSNGSVSRLHSGAWIGADSFGEVMTLLDLVCDSREDRCISGHWKNMTAFGLQFHQNLMENPRDPWADRFEADLDGFRRACESMGGVPFSHGDAAYAIEVFDGLPIVIQLWLGDEEFPAQLRYLWDENALMYIKYETMYYCLGLLHSRLLERMEENV